LLKKQKLNRQSDKQQQRREKCISVELRTPWECQAEASKAGKVATREISLLGVSLVAG
jgi:hypothetical protein